MYISLSPITKEAPKRQMQSMTTTTIDHRRSQSACINGLVQPTNFFLAFLHHTQQSTYPKTTKELQESIREPCLQTQLYANRRTSTKYDIWQCLSQSVCRYST
jgi:hypothetical protein